MPVDYDDVHNLAGLFIVSKIRKNRMWVYNDYDMTGMSCSTN